MMDRCFQIQDYLSLDENGNINSNYIRQQLESPRKLPPQCKVLANDQVYLETEEKKPTDEGTLPNKDQGQKHQNCLVSKVLEFQYKSEEEEIGKRVFIQKPIKKIKKNHNLPKYICRLYIDHFHKYCSIIEDTELESEIKRMLRGKRAESLKNKNLFYNRKHIKSFINRKIMNIIISREVFSLLHPKSRIKQSFLSYLIALKVFKHRTTNRFLVERLQYK